MAVIGDALRQAFMPKRDYDNLREEEKAWGRLQRPLIAALASIIGSAVIVSVSVSLRIVFPGESGRRIFCHEKRFQSLSMRESDAHPYRGAFYLTDNEAAEYYWLVLFIPSGVIFFVSAIYLFAGILVACSPSPRHWCLKVVENDFCASRRGGVHCLFILNAIFALIFALMGLFMGSSLLTLGSSCSVPLFWCYQVTAWGLVALYGGAAVVLRRKAAAEAEEENDEGDSGRGDVGLEMLGPARQISPLMERRVNEGFRAWMGSGLLSSSDDEDDDESPVAQFNFEIP